MRASVASLSKKFISTFFAATLALGLVPAAAFAVDGENSEFANADRVEVTNDVISSDNEKSALIEQNEGEALTDSWEDAEAAVIPAATERVNEDVALTTRTVAQAESTRTYFLAQTLESTRTVPIVSANLPLDTGATTEPETDGDSATEEGGEDSDESDLPTSSIIAVDSTVIGSFEDLGMTFAVEPGGETVALMAVDYNKLPESFIEMQVIAVPDAVTPDGIDYYSMTRIADNAFSSLTKENANPDYTGCVALFEASEEGIPETNPLEDCTGILALAVPASVSSVGDAAFADCTIQYLVVSDDNPTYSSYDGALYNADQTSLLLIPGGRLGAVRVASSVTEVSPEAFSHCPSVDTLVADPDSAAYQLLSKSDLNNADNEPIAIISYDEGYLHDRQARFDIAYKESISAIGMTEQEAVSDSAVSFGVRSVKLGSLTSRYSIFNNQNCIADVTVYIGGKRDHVETAYGKFGEFAYARDCDALKVFGDFDAGQYVSFVTGSGAAEVAYDVGNWRSTDVGFYIENRYSWSSNELIRAEIGTYTGTGVLYCLTGMTNYTISYAANGGNGSHLAASGLFWDNWIILPAPENCGITRPGYTLTGWSVNGHVYSVGKSLNVKSLAEEAGRAPNLKTDAFSLAAVWTENTDYSVTFKTKVTGAETNLASKSNLWYESQSFAAPTASEISTMFGYTLLGWSKTDPGTKVYSKLSDAPGTTYAPGATLTIKGLYGTSPASGTLFAVYKANGYTITLNTDGGSVSGWTTVTANSKYTKAYDVTSAATTLPTPSRSGYSFDGWTGSNGTTAQKSVTVDKGTTGDKTYTANWTIIDYTVTWNYDGGDNKTTETQSPVHYGDEISMREPGKKEGWSFGGWELQSGSKPVYQKNQTYTMGEGSVTFKAVWNRGSNHQVSLADEMLHKEAKKTWYWPGNGYVATETSQNTVNTNGKLVADPQLSAEPHYEFLGYFDTQDQKENGAEHMMVTSDGLLTEHAPELSGPVSWFAHWRLLSTQVDLYATYGNPEFAVVSDKLITIERAVYGDSFTDSVSGGEVAAPKRVGYEFLGYWTEQNEDVAKGATPNGKCWISVDADGKCVLSTEDWGPSPNIDEDPYTVPLYAAWRIIDCNVTLNTTDKVDANTEPIDVVGGGTVSSQIWHYGETRPSLPTPEDGSFSRNGYTFKGWYYLDGNEKVFVSDSEGNPTPEVWDKDGVKSLTIYPDWEAKTYELAFAVECPDVEGLTKPDAPVNMKNIVYDTSGFELPEISYGAYTLQWLTASNEVFADVHMTDGRFTPRGDLTSQTSVPIVLHAKWTAPDETHTFTLYTGHPGTGEVIAQKNYEFAYGEPRSIVSEPDPIEGYEFDYWVQVGSADEAVAMIENRKVTGERVDAISGLDTEDLFFVAKWSAHELSVTLVTTPDDDGEYFDAAHDVLVDRTAEDAATWSAAYGKAYPEASADEWKHASKMVYDVELGAFALPEVVRTGYDFVGWEPVDEASEIVFDDGVVDPRAQAGSIALHAVSYRPLFKAAAYEIRLLGNGLGADEETETVLYDESFIFPCPTTLATGSTFRCWANVSELTGLGTDKCFLKGTSVPLAPGIDSTGKETPGLASFAAPGTRIVTLYAIWEKGYSVDVPIVASLAIDVDTNDVIATKHTLTPKSTNAAKSYEIESLRYEPAYETIDGVKHTAFEGAKTGEVYLSIYAGLPAKLDDERNLLRSTNVGTNGAVAYADSRSATPLLIELGGTSSRLFPKEELEKVTMEKTYGFLPFDTSNYLTIRYGLYFPKAETAKKFDFARGIYTWRLPENDHANSDGLSSGSMGVAKLTYTVSMKDK